MSMPNFPPSISPGPQPAWDVARLFPPQGLWSESDYLELTASTNRLVEFVDGCIEVLDMPTESHQLIVQYLVDCLRAFVDAQELGRVLFAPLRVRTQPNKFREPDVIFMLAENAARRKEEYWDGADLVMEVVSAGETNRDRDLKRKRAEYAASGIPEYWIVDPLDQRIIVLRLEGDTYVTHGEFLPGQSATSSLLEGFAVHVSAVFDAASA